MGVELAFVPVKVTQIYTCTGIPLNVAMCAETGRHCLCLKWHEAESVATFQ